LTFTVYLILLIKFVLLFLCLSSLQHDQWKSFELFHGKRHPDPQKPSLLIKYLEAGCLIVFVTDVSKKYLFPRHRFEHHRNVYLHASPLHHAKRLPHHVPFLIVHGSSDILVTVEESRFVG
jgi:hypothetical protein